jgi:hypothetical protein
MTSPDVMEMGSMQARTRMARLTVMVALAGLLVGLVPGDAGAGTYGGRYRERWLMLKATNGDRSNHVVRRVNLHDQLSKLARKHSLKMARTQDLFHTKDPSRYYLRGKKWSWWGENVGVTSGGVAGLEKAFMESAPHRANILNNTFRHIAIGAVRRDGILWVTVFFWG